MSRYDRYDYRDDYYDDDDDYYFVNDDYTNNNNNNRNSYKKSIKSHIIKEDITYKKKRSKSNNTKIIRDLFSNDLIEKLSVYIHQNNIKKIKSFLSQYNLYMNKDINDYNNSIVRIKNYFL
jgi:hypothetical protein